MAKQQPPMRSTGSVTTPGGRPQPTVNVRQPGQPKTRPPGQQPQGQQPQGQQPQGQQPQGQGEGEELSRQYPPEGYGEEQGQGEGQEQGQGGGGFATAFRTVAVELVRNHADSIAAAFGFDRQMVGEILTEVASEFGGE